MENGKLSTGMILLLILLFIGGCCFWAEVPKSYTIAKLKAEKVTILKVIPQIKTALDKYASEHKGIVPPDVATLTSEGYLPAEFFKSSPIMRQMKQINFGETPYSGKFTYIPVTIDGAYRAYYLFGYGNQMTGKSMDVDGDGEGDYVIILLSGPDDPEIKAKMPPLADLLKRSK